jgi:hypothetical protein
MSQISIGAIRKRALYGAFLVVLIPGAPLAGRIVGTTWGAINGYRTGIQLFHSRHIALAITAQVFRDAYRSYLCGR